MSNPNLPLGIALVCGAAACAITCAVTDLGVGVGVTLGAAVAGASLIFQGQQKPAEQKEEKDKEKESKKSKAKKSGKKQTNTSSTPRAPTSQAPATPEPAEKKKKSKKEKDAPKSPPPPPKSPAPKSPPQQQNQPKAKSPQVQKSPSVEVDDTKKEPTKTQLQKAKKKQKKEAEEKAKAEEKALEVKREQAQAKKAAKAAQKKKEIKEAVSPQSQASDEEDAKEEEFEDGVDGVWEKPKPRNTVRIRSPKDAKKGKEASKDIPAPAPNEPKVVIYVNIPKAKHGGIIGPKGTYLEAIKKKTGADVKMPQRQGGGDKIVISGFAGQVQAAEQAIKDIATQGFSNLTHPDFESNEILIDDEKLIGRIAGKGGYNIKIIQEKSGASLVLPDRKSPHPSNKIIIYGKTQEIYRAKLAIMELINQGYCEYTHPGWVAEEFPFPPDALGRLIGPGGTKIVELSDTYDVKIDTPKKDDPTAKQDVIVIKGLQSNIDRAKEAINELLATVEVVDELPPVDPNDPWQQDPVEPEW